MNPELKELLAAFDAGIARLCEIIDRAEARFAVMEATTEQPDPLADHPELPLATSSQHPIPGINCDINGKPIQP
jgi:hypothetical protein